MGGDPQGVHRVTVAKKTTVVVVAVVVMVVVVQVVVGLFNHRHLLSILHFRLSIKVMGRMMLLLLLLLLLLM